MNKKLIKSIVSITCGLGVATSIPFAATSCGSSSEDDVVVSALPEEVYEFSEDGKTLLGFKNEFLNDSASDIYKDKFKNDCDTILIPDRITSIGESAFENGSATTIPEFISHINFSKNSNCTSVGYRAFINNNSITSLTLPSKLTLIESNGFKSLMMLSSIIWDGWQGPSDTSVLQEAFLFAGDSVTDSPLTLKVTNPTGGNNSEALLQYLKGSNRRLPERWEVGK